MKKLRSIAVHFAEGFLMGGADIIPGVSGGTMALIVGIYRRLIAALSSGFSAVVAALRLDGRAMIGHLRDIEWKLILPLGTGIGTALVLGAHIIPTLIERYPHECLGLFFGLVAGSLAIPWQRIERKTALGIALALAAAVAAFLLTGIPPGDAVDPSYLRVFLSAAVAICAMILPGVSGAFLLKVLGIYEVSLIAITEADVAYVAVFVLGAAVGLGSFSKLLNFLLERWHDWTMAALVGMMGGSLRALWPWQGADRGLYLPAPGEPVGTVVAIGVAGFVFVTLLGILARRIEARADAAPAEQHVPARPIEEEAGFQSARD